MTRNDIAGLIDEFRTLLPEGRYSAREAAALSGVPHSTIADFRRGEIPQLHQSTRRKMQEFIELQRSKSSVFPVEPTERAALLLAADRLEQVAAELRAQASGKERPTHETVSQVKRAASAVKAARQGKPQKRAGHKGG